MRNRTSPCRPRHARTARAQRLLGFATALVLSCVFAGCATNPWPENFIQAATLDPPLDPEFDRPDLELVEFEDATPDAATPPDGMRFLGHASFTARYPSDPQKDLRAFAAEIGAHRVVWSLRHLHTEIDTDLRLSTGFSSGRIYGGHGYDDDLRFGGSVTQYVPVTREDAYYAFRAVFYSRKESPR